MGCGGSKDEKKPKEGSVKSGGNAKSPKSAQPKSDKNKEKKSSTPLHSAKSQAEDYPVEQGAGAAVPPSASSSELSPHSIDSPHSTGVTNSRASTPATHCSEKDVTRDVDAGEDLAVEPVAAAAAAEAREAEEAANDAASAHSDAEPHARAVCDEPVPYSARREGASVARVAAPGTPRKTVPTEIYALKMRRVEEEDGAVDIDAIPKSPRIFKPMPMRCRNTRMSVVKQRRLAQINQHDNPNEYQQLD